MRKTARAPSWINLAIGLWVLLSPWLLGFNESGRPTWTAVVTGLAITLVAAVAVARSSPTAAWGNVLLAIWLFASPWVVGYTEFRSASGTRGSSPSQWRPCWRCATRAAREKPGPTTEAAG